MRLSPKWRMAALGGVAILTLAGCGSSSPGEATLGAAVSLDQTTGVAIDGCDAELIKDCIDSQEDMRLLFDYTEQRVRAFAAEEVPDYPTDTVWKYVGAGESGEEGCVDYTGAPAQYTDRSYEFCPPDQTIYVGEALMWEFYQDNGHAGPSIGVAHEWGHSIQHEAGVFDVVDSREAYIAAENQADCIAGAWFRSEIRARVASRSDVVDVGTMMAAVSSQESPDRTHGTIKEREIAFFLGVGYGLERCNEYFPEAPLVQPSDDGS